MTERGLVVFSKTFEKVELPQLMLEEMTFKTHREITMFPALST